ncbi:BTAD domain-containing putative transcriptional regulator [Pseudonocardia xinjiangensis]|uniref:BTAD domain-containing putative transcriptional regulator n=1 Tax=Pseudonocardia xinjiangensis TaxID=75289 RepID=UPI003D93543A
MRITLLGAVEVWPDGTDHGGDPGPVPLGGPRLRGLLARLALDAGRAVAASELVDDLWGETPPDAAVNALQALVSRLRRAIGADLVDTAARGYRLRVPPDAVDALRFTALVTAADAAGETEAHTLLGQAVALWDGPALADVLDLPFARPVAHRLTERRAVAVERRARLGLRLGNAAAEIDALRVQLDAAPLRESTAVLLARALHADGRQADALAVLDGTRSRLADELGVDPGAELEAARLAVLRGDATPARKPLVAAPPPPQPTAPISSFVGRSRDVDRIRDLLRTTRLVTLTGPGGAGKTRLAREAVASGASGSMVAELAALTTADQLPAAVLTAAGGPELQLRTQDDVGPPTTDRLVTVLGGRDLVLVLDNCEHLVDGVAVLAETLLHACPRLRVLATSREPLGVPGEVLHPVEALAPSDAVRLFVDRATAVRPGFALTPDVEEAVVEICRRLDGQPLPIELAAARLRSLAPAEIATRLDDRFRLLTSGSRTALPRHQTLRAVVDWSWDLLTEPERAVARRLAVFAGGATVTAAERVCSGAPGPAPGEVFELLAALVDKSLVVAVPQNEGNTRYRMLETIREYAGERLDEAGERAAAQATHAAVVLELAEAAEPLLRGAEQLHWLVRLRAEADEIDIVLRRAVTASDAATAHRLVAAMAWSWIERGLFDEVERWVEAVQLLTGPAPLRARAMNTAFLALVRVGRGNLPAAAQAVETALALAAGLPRPLPPLLELLGPVSTLFSRADAAPIEQLSAVSPDPWVRAFALQMRAQIAENDGLLDDQRRYVRAAHELFIRTGDRFGLGMVVHSLGELEDIAGEHDAAARAYDEAIALATELGNDDDLPHFMSKRASLAARRGDLGTARKVLEQARALTKGPFGLGGVLAISSAQVERLAGDLDAARAHLAGAATEMGSAGPGAPQRWAFLAMTRAAVELTAGDRQASRAALRDAVAAAVESRDGPVAAAVAEVAAQVVLADGDAECAGLLLGIAAAQRGAIDRGNPEVLAVRDGVSDALGPEAADQLMRRGRDLPRADGLAALTEVVARAAELRGLPAVLGSSNHAEETGGERRDARSEVEARRP